MSRFSAAGIEAEVPDEETPHGSNIRPPEILPLLGSMGAAHGCRPHFLPGLSPESQYYPGEFLLPDDLGPQALGPPAIPFAVENPLPGAQARAPFGDGYHHLQPMARLRRCAAPLSSLVWSCR